MRGGRIGWWTKISGPLQRKLDELIDARVLSGRAIFDKLNLSRFTGLSTFRDYYALRRKVRRARRRRKGEGSAGILPAIPAENADETSALPARATDLPGKVNEIIALTVDKAYEALLTDNVGKVQLARLLSELQDLKEHFDIDLVAEQRAAELHAAKMAGLQAKLKRAIGAKTEAGKKSLTRAAIYDEIDKVMRGET